MTKLLLCVLAAVLFCILLTNAASTATRGAQDAAAARQDLIKRGAAIYKTRCLVCHAAEGKSPNPRMRFADHQWNHGNKPEQIQKVVADGVKGTVMMGFRNRLNESDIKAVAAYVLDLSEKATP